MRENWKSKAGFIFAALGSAVGLGSIWRFPYVVGENGGAVFIFLYILCLFLIGFPVLIAEIIIGKATQKSPSLAFKKLSNSSLWEKGGLMTLVTGFIISSFYSVIAGIGFGYLIEAISGNLSNVTSASQASATFQALSANPVWCVGFHFFFLLLALFILFSGVRKGIEVGSKIMMPLLIFVLILLVIKGLSLPSASKGLTFLFSPDFSSVTPGVFLMALGQAFFTLSLGQGTMITYGSYLPKKANVLKTLSIVVLLNTIIAILMGVAIFTVVFDTGIAPTAGPALLFETLPLVFSQITGGYWFSILFFLLVTIAALTSEISALEPMISYFIDKKNMKRKKAVLITVLGAFILGIPSALSFSYLKDLLFHKSFFTLISDLSVNILVPLGGFIAVLLVGWKTKRHLELLLEDKHKSVRTYFKITTKYLAPFLILLILMHLLGVY
jgi:NSS family neurotransmitter:Na+ symporter